MYAMAWPHQCTTKRTERLENLETKVKKNLAVCQNLVPLVNIKIAGKWMFIPLKMVLIGIDPYPSVLGTLEQNCCGFTPLNSTHRKKSKPLREYFHAQGPSRFHNKQMFFSTKLWIWKALIHSHSEVCDNESKIVYIQLLEDPLHNSILYI